MRDDDIRRKRVLNYTRRTLTITRFHFPAVIFIFQNLRNLYGMLTILFVTNQSGFQYMLCKFILYPYGLCFCTATTMTCQFATTTSITFLLVVEASM